MLYDGEITTTYGMESLPLNGSKNNFSYQENREHAFKEVTLSNTTRETALFPTLVVLGVTGAAILGGPIAAFL